jgi:hypothetical protein
MCQGRRRKRTLRVKRVFEPGRLCQCCLRKAYEQIVPEHICIVRAVSDKEIEKIEVNEHQVEGVFI